MMMVFDDIKTIPYKLSFHNFFQYLIPSLLIHIELDPTFYAHTYTHNYSPSVLNYRFFRFKLSYFMRVLRNKRAVEEI